MSDPLAAILAVVTSFVAATTTRDVAVVEARLAPTAVQHVRLGDAWSPMPTSVYVKLLRDGAIGGEPVDLVVHDVSLRGSVATVVATRTTPTLRFDDVFTLAEIGTSWQIVGAAVVATPSKH